MSSGNFFAKAVFLFFSFIVMSSAPGDPISVSQAGELPDVVRICTDAEWPPYDYKDPGNERKAVGATIDILHEIFKRGGLETDISIVPWKRCEIGVENGEYHMIIDLSKNAEREKKYLVSEPLYELNHVFYYDKGRYPDGPGIGSVKDVDGFSVGSILGYNLGIYKFDISKVDSGTKTIAKLLRKLRAGRIDLAIGYVEIWQGLAAMGKTDLKGLGHVKIPEMPSAVYHVMFTRKKGKGGEALLGIFDRELGRLRSEGRYREIFENHGISSE